jgi:hypothetical protein
MERNRTGAAAALMAAFTRVFTMRAARAQQEALLTAQLHDEYRRHRPSRQHRPAGSKIARKASEGTLTKRHPSPVDSYFADITAKRAKAERLRKQAAKVLRTTRQATLRKFAFEG